MNAIEWKKYYNEIALFLILVIECYNISYVSIANSENKTQITQGIVAANQNSFKSEWKVFCKEGFVLEGDGILKCQLKGYWSLKPICKG